MTIDDGLIREALELKFPLGLFSEERRREVQPVVVAEMSSAVLVEIIIEGADERFTSDDFGQPSSEQAAYMESYLSRDGDSGVSRYERPPGDSLRVAFFLHDFDEARPLKTCYGEVSVSTPTEMPERLSKVMRYAPVD